MGTIRQYLLYFCTLAILATVFHPLRAQTNAPTPISRPASDSAQRVKLFVGQSRELFFAQSITSALVIDPEFVSAAVKGERGLNLTGLRNGETMVIVSSEGGRQTLVVEVTRRPAQQTAAVNKNAVRPENLGPSGMYSVSFSPAFGSGPALLRQTFEQELTLGSNRTLRASADVSKLFGGSEGQRALTRGFGVNRLSLGVSTPAGTLNVLDSDLNLSRLSLSGYGLRGLHLVTTPESRWRGAELFSGVSRPSPLSYSRGEGRLAGVLVPVAAGKTWRVRAGIIGVFPRSNVEGENGGLVWQTDARYSPDGNTNVEGEIAYSKGGLSWRARLDLRRGPFLFAGETLRLKKDSPFVSIGAQQGGRSEDLLTFRWHPRKSFTTSVTYNRTSLQPRADSRRPETRAESFVAYAAYSFGSNSRLSLRFAESKAQSIAPATGSTRLLESQSAGVSYFTNFGRRWSNQFEARLTSSREGQARAEMDRGFVVRDELRRAWSRWSASVYVNYTHNTPSLESLILRNPTLLPPILRRAFEEDPAGFLELNRASLSSLLFGLALPETRDTNMGLRLQGKFSRYTFTTETRLSAGEISGRSRHELITTFGATIRLDAANSLQVGGSRSFALGLTGDRTALTVSYTHRFGGGSRDGFQLTQLFGLGRGRLEGRAFLDLNGNGVDDPDEPGLGGMKVQLAGDRNATTDERGHFRFASVSAGENDVALISPSLGVRLQGSTPTQRRFTLAAGQTMKVSFGLTNFAAIRGRVFNDLLLTSVAQPVNAPGIGGILLTLTSDGVGGEVTTIAQTVDASGVFSFTKLPPGRYKVEIDSTTLPANYNPPIQSLWHITVEPLQVFNLNIGLVAQRAISGVVFIDKDGDGKFDQLRDEVVEGARVRTGEKEVRTGRDGAYILRGVPAGRIEVTALSRLGVEIKATIELGVEPATRRGINFAVTP